jgi:hypothetical protein
MMMNTTTITMMRAAAKSATRSSALLSRPSLAYLGRRFSAQMQINDKSDNETLHAKMITPPPNKSKKDQLLAGYREYLDKMMGKTSKIESSMQALRETSLAQKKQYATGTTIKWMDASEIDKLFDESVKHKQDISTELSELKSFLQDAHQDARFYGVDAPDGESDWHVQEEMQEINHIIDDAAVLEDKDEVMRRHKMEAETASIFAVDAPDGESDGYVNKHLEEEMQEIKNIIDFAAVTEDKDAVMQRHKMKEGIYAVDAPDGDSDGHVQEELHEIQRIIDSASMSSKDKTAINSKLNM